VAKAKVGEELTTGRDAGKEVANGGECEGRTSAIGVAIDVEIGGCGPAAAAYPNAGTKPLGGRGPDDGSKCVPTSGMPAESCDEEEGLSC